MDITRHGNFVKLAKKAVGNNPTRYLIKTVKKVILKEQAMRVIETGKHKGKILADCPKEYPEWAAKHEKNFHQKCIEPPRFNG